MIEQKSIQTAPPSAPTQPSMYSLTMLTALSAPVGHVRTGLRHVYGGTVPPEVVAVRRRRNRIARRSRRINRMRRCAR